MRFMMMIKNDEQAEAGVLPDPKLFEAMGQYNQVLVDAGALMDAAGLHPSSEGVRLKFHSGAPTVTDGPFAEAKEVVGGYWIIKAGSLDEAVEWTKRCFRTVEEVAGPQGDGTGEIEVRQLFDLEDFPVNENESGWREMEAAEREAPSVQPQPGLKQFIVFRMADAATERGDLPSEELLAAMGAYNEKLIQQGVMIGGEGLQPSSKGAKVRYSNGKISVIDGPFTESKELIAGFSLLQAKSLDEVIELAKGWPREDGDVELRIRQVYGEEDFGDALPPEAAGQEARLKEQVAAQQAAQQQR